MTTTLDTTAAIAAAVTEVYEQLRDLVDRGPTNDPSLLDEIGAIVRRARGRVTRARKRVKVDAPERPAMTPPTAEPSVQPAPQAAAAIPAANSPTPDRVTVRLAEPTRTAAARATVEQPAAAAVHRHRHRRPSRMSRIWAAVTMGAEIVNTTTRLVLLAVALTVAGYGMFIALEQTDIPWIAAPFAGLYAIASSALLAFTYRMRSRRWGR